MCKTCQKEVDEIPSSPEPVVLDNHRELIPLGNQVEINSYEKWGCLVLFWS